MNRKRIAPAEMEILRFVMDRQPVTAREVAEAMAERKGFARTTVQTLLERLRAKGHLVRTTENGVNRYSLGQDKAEVMKGLVGEFFDKTLGGSVSPFVAFLAERGNLSDEEAAELARLLEKIDREEPA